MKQKTTLAVIFLILAVIVGLLLFIITKFVLNNTKSKSKITETIFPTKTWSPSPTPIKTPTPRAKLGKNDVTKNVALVIINPTDQNGLGIIEKYNWTDPKILANQYVKAISDASGGHVIYKITKIITQNHFPQKKNGFTLDSNYYSRCILNPDDNCRQIIDYKKFFDELNLCGDISQGNINEIWAFNGPWFGFWEWSVKGRKINTLQENLPDCGGKTYAIMGFSFERSLSEMLEDLGHRFEYSIPQVKSAQSDWKIFTSKEYCGSVHIPPNGTTDYDWSNSQIAESSCDGFLTYPKISNAKKSLTCQTWNCSGEQYKKWWISHIPNLWWSYAIDPDNSL